MIRPRKKPRPGRLKGDDLKALRWVCWIRDNGHCVNCDRNVWEGLPHTAPNSYHMSHIKAKRMGGDSLDNVETLCGDCHRDHHNGTVGGKMFPRKEKP